MSTNNRKLLLSVTLGVTGLMFAGCKSTPTEPEATADAGATTTPSNLSLPAGQTAEAEAEASTAGDDYGDRAAPFSEERVNALESQLKPLDNIPVPKEALPSPNGNGLAERF